MASPAIAPPTSFFWSTPDLRMGDFSIPACSSVQIITFPNPGTSVAPAPPFTFLAFPVGGIAETQSTSMKLGDGFNWTANFPEGTPFILGMLDKDGNSGGTVGPYTITAGSTSCNYAAAFTPLSVVLDPPNGAPCGELDLKTVGGVPPYVVSVLSPALGLYSMLSNVSTNPIRLQNTIPNGQQFYIYVTDATGASSQISNPITSGLGLPTCLEPAAAKPSPSTTPSSESSSRSSTPIGAIVGGSVGGAIVLLLLLLAAFYYTRKKKTVRAKEAHRQELKLSPEYRMADGSAPLVTPFVVMPLKSYDDSDSAPWTGQSHSPQSDSPSRTSPYASSTRRLAPAAPPVPFSPGPQSSTTSYATAFNDQQYEAVPTALNQPGLANPDDFSYREPSYREPSFRSARN